MNHSNQELESIKHSVIDIVVNEKGRPIPPGIILHKLQNTYKEIPNYRNKIYQAIDQLIETHELKQLRNKSILIGYVNAAVDLNFLQEGVIAINDNGAGFITLDNKKKSEYYVFKTNLNGALHGDRVQFAIMQKPPRGDLKDAVVTKVVAHAKDFYVGTITIDANKNYKIKLDDNKFYLDLQLDSIEGLVSGQKILIRVNRYESKHAFGSVSRIIGHVNDVGVDILSIVYDNGVEPDFPNSVLEYAKSLRLDIDDYQRKIRKNLTDLPIVTIDPSTSKDFDDAIYVKRISADQFYLSVSIADVSHYVKFNSILDEEALKRGCSIYLVDRVIPMLPHNLSDDLCSLNPNVERLALTCDTIIDKLGKIVDIKIYPSIIKSHRRYSYDEVNAFFLKKDELAKDPPEVKQMLQDALALHQILSRAKNQRGYINFEIPQPIIVVNKEGKPVEIKKYQSGLAQHMIEDFMVIANEAVTIYANKQKWPFVYRVHDKPSIDRLKTFSLEAKKLNFKISTNIENIQPADITKWINENQNNSNLDLINMMLLRTMAKAEYETKNIGHFGLALENYTHFTSPIRRYSDLLVHRIFWTYDFEKQKNSDEKRNQISQLLPMQASLTSKNELRSIKCERDVQQMKFAEFIQDHIGEEYDGFVSSIYPFGLFVQLPNTIEGFIRLENMKNDFYSYNEKTNELIGKKTGQRFSLGTKVKIKVIAANKETRKIEFAMVSYIRK